MSSPLAPFPNVETALEDILAPLATTGTVTPADLQQELPYIRIRRVGGSDDRLTDRPRVDVDVFAGSYSVGQPLAEQVRQLLTAAPHRTGDVVVDTVTTLTGPFELPWDDPNVRRWIATYEITCRR